MCHAQVGLLALRALPCLLTVVSGLGHAGAASVGLPVNGSGSSSIDEALRVATTSSGGRIFAAGLQEDELAVVAYRYGGTVAWRARFQPPGRFTATYVENIVVAAGDREVVVTAPLIGPYKDPMAVVAFDAMTGHLDWSWLSTRSTSPKGLAAGPGRVVVAGSEGRSATPTGWWSPFDR